MGYTPKERRFPNKIMSKTGILLESGTNELEIVEFHVNHVTADGSVETAFYGVNVSKVKEIIKSPEKLADIPRAHPSISGVVNLRGKIIPIIDLPKWLGRSREDLVCRKVIITEFNNIQIGFLVHDVARIHRVSWSAVETPSGIMNQAEKECITGIVKFDEKILMMLDFEKIVSEINPDLGQGSMPKIGKSSKRTGKTIFIAEDSAFVRKQMIDLLKGAGYRVFSAANGKLALQKLTEAAKQSENTNHPITSYLNLIISDVEMPQMDGLHLTAKLKEHPLLKKVPVLIYSSLVTEENKKKWKAIGAENFISKPDIEKLVQHVDRLVI